MKMRRMACLIGAVLILAPGWIQAQPDRCGNEDESILNKSWFQPDLLAEEDLPPDEAMPLFPAPGAGERGFGPPPPGERPRGPRPGMRMLGPGGLLGLLRMSQEQFDITNEQMERIKELSFKLEELGVKQRNADALQGLEMAKLLSNPENRDYAAIQALMEKTSQTRIKSLIEEMKMRDLIRKVLSPEQWRAIREEGRDRMERAPGFLPDPAAPSPQKPPRIRRDR